jgi:ubiquitin-conjugating enzyme E2 W
MNSSATRCLKRLQKEREDLDKFTTLKYEFDSKNQFLMKVSFSGAEDTLYTGENFTLQFKFSEEYVKFFTINFIIFYIKILNKPIESPEVIFIGTPPIHPHIYSNGYICLSILYQGII